MARFSTAQRAGVMSLACVAVFWVGIAVAGWLAPGYSPRDDYISALASRGSSAAPLGISVLTALGLAYVAAAVAVWAVVAGARPVADARPGRSRGSARRHRADELCQWRGRVRDHDPVGA